MDMINVMGLTKKSRPLHIFHLYCYVTITNVAQNEIVMFEIMCIMSEKVAKQVLFRNEMYLKLYEEGL